MCGLFSNSLSWLIMFHEIENLLSYFISCHSSTGLYFFHMPVTLGLLDMLSLVDILLPILCVTNLFSYFISQPTLTSSRTILPCFPYHVLPFHHLWLFHFAAGFLSPFPMALPHTYKLHEGQILRVFNSWLGLQYIKCSWDWCASLPYEFTQ